MNSSHVFRKEFPNGWLVDVKFNPNGFNDMYSTDYKYSVMIQHIESGFASFENIEKASEVFKYIGEVLKW